jgi:hypothetical protein
MFSQNYLLIILIILFQTNESIVIIKWITQNTFNDSFIELEQPLTNTEDSCKWYKLTDNREIDEAGKNYKQDYNYKLTSKQCNLLIINYNNKTHTQLDFYTPVIRSVSNNKPQNYVLAYLKSFNLKIKQYNTTSTEIICEIKISFPDTNDKSLNNQVNEALQKSLTLSSTQNDDKISRNYEILSSLKTSISPMDSNKIKRSVNSKLIVDYTIVDSLIINHKTNKNDVKCHLNLLDGNNKKTVYQQVIKMPIENVYQTSKATTSTKTTVS